MRKGAPWLKTTLIQCGWAAARKKRSYLQAQFHRLRARRGAKKAIGAVAASMLTAANHMLKDGTLYQDLGADHFDLRVGNRKAALAHHLRQIAEAELEARITTYARDDNLVVEVTAREPTAVAIP